jgi:hypothetical protein
VIPEGPESQTGQAMRATSDALLAQIEELAVLERAKRDLDPSDPALVQVSRRIEILAGHVLGATTEERLLTQQAQLETVIQAPGAPTEPINETEPRHAHEILADWRDAERRAAAAAPGSPEAAAAAHDIDRLRFEYQRVFATRHPTEPTESS